MPRWWERVSFCWCVREEEEVGKRLMLSGLARAPPWQSWMLDPSTSDLPLRPSHPVLPTVPAGWHTQCAQNYRLGWLFGFRTMGCSSQGHGHLIDTPKQPRLTLFASAVIPFAISWPSFFSALVSFFSSLLPNKEPALNCFFPPWSLFSHIHPNLVFWPPLPR